VVVPELTGIGGTAESGQRGFAADALRVVPGGHQKLRGGLGSDCGDGAGCRCGLGDQVGHLLVGLGDFASRICTLGPGGVGRNRDSVAETAQRPGGGDPVLRTTKASAMKARKAAINQMHSVLVGAPDELRASMTGLNRGALVGRCARLRADVSRIGEPATTA